MQKFIAEESFWKLFPDSEIGLIVVRNMKTADEVSDEDQAEIADRLKKANDAADNHLESDTISENEVVRVWREAYRQFKTKKGARSSVENLLKRVLKGNPVGNITPSVDLYNIISLTYALPVGGEDINSFVGDVRLGVTEGGDDFWPLGEDKEEPTLPGEVCYRDDKGAICRCWNWRDGVRTALSDDARDALLIIENVDARRSDDLHAALDELAELIKRYLGATIERKEIITQSNPEMVLVD
ncbi:MAG: B3/4 domain-containing protein [Eggerthellaceae bacterium]|jgi:DNA/RNA-binding domain of Phe-tRNA-synthetase-like protein